jgi:hypothetical protein
MPPAWQTCPSCGQSQPVYRVSSLRERIDSRRSPVSAAVVQALNLPPRPELYRLPGHLTGLGLFLALSSAAVLAWQHSSSLHPLAFTTPGGLTRWPVLGVLAGLGILLTKVAYDLAAYARYVHAELRWTIAKQRWDRLYYCQSCRGVFEADKGKLVPLDRLLAYLNGSDPTSAAS